MWALYFLFLVPTAEGSTSNDIYTIKLDRNDSKLVKEALTKKILSIKGFEIQCEDLCIWKLQKSKIHPENKIFWGANASLIFTVHNQEEQSEIKSLLSTHEIISNTSIPYTSIQNEKIFSSPKWKITCKEHSCIFLFSLTK